MEIVEIGIAGIKLMFISTMSKRPSKMKIIATNPPNLSKREA
ncbi:hypothetical protein Belba_0542 [Belliella baltica DSM 15883]|uniref:Uncharacterized protein n=1 Tax=Belliella baltica (strain DSM 15883 / CIP 108006 / LMG 21964 / BA134) TaxID=866536 RepID=I3Z1T2_BELBD|nr:hypothetical protein Belba_0542 [Belliella baltica DSM 15883]